MFVLNDTQLNSMIVTFHAINRGDTGWAPPSGMTEAVEIFSSTAAGGTGLEISYVLQAAAGATGTKTATVSPTGQSGETATLGLSER